MKKEIERKFLLKALPTIYNYFEVEIQNIIQYYYFSDNVWKRIRKIESNTCGNPSKNIYLHTIKTYKDGICYEDETNYSYEEYMSLMSEINSGKYECRAIMKTRYIYPTDFEADFEGEIKKLKWEIDVFNFSLIIAEIEIPDINHPIEIPEYIKNNIIYEVTSINEFSNRSLSEALNFSNS